MNTRETEARAIIVDVIGETARRYFERGGTIDGLRGLISGAVDAHEVAEKFYAAVAKAKEAQ